MQLIIVHLISSKWRSKGTPTTQIAISFSAYNEHYIMRSPLWTQNKNNSIIHIVTTWITVLV